MRLRLFLSFVLVVLISIFSVVVIVRFSMAREIRNFMYRGGMVGLENLVGDLETYYQTNRAWQGAERLMRTASHGMGSGMMNQRLRLADAEKNILVDTSNIGVLGKLTAFELAASIPLRVGGRTVGYLLPQGGMAFGPGDQINLLFRLNRAALVTAIIAGSLSLVLALLLAYSLLRPVSELTRAAQGLAKGNLSQRVPVHGDDELATLGETFNRMAESLEQAEISRRAMTADIAHELRTPLAVQRAHLEALRDGVYPLAQENLDPILEQNLLLTRLVEDLRTLALADAGQLTLERVPTDLGNLVQRVVGQFEPQAAYHHANLRFIQEEAAPSTSEVGLKPHLSVDPARIEQILSNLIANALRYTPEGGTITLTLAYSPTSTQVSVQDSGPGIPEQALGHIFERFYRVDHSRSRAEGGTGLGLAIARQLAEAHGGTLTAANHPQGGAVFTLVLPL